MEGRIFRRMAEAPAFQPAHCRGARALLDWTQAQLAERADVGRMTVKRFEAGESVRPAQAAAIRSALQKAGALFLPEGLSLGGRTVTLGVALSGGDVAGVGAEPEQTRLDDDPS